VLIEGCCCLLVRCRLREPDLADRAASPYLLICTQPAIPYHWRVFFGTFLTTSSQKDLSQSREPRQSSRYGNEATDWTVGGSYPGTARCFSIRQNKAGSGTHPASQSKGTRGIKRPERDAEHSPHLVPRPKMCWAVPLHPVNKCFSTAGPRPGTGPWHQLYRAARGSPGICHFSFLSNFH